MKFSLKQKMDYAKHLRENMTPAESMLWSRINKSQLGYRFVRQGVLWGYIPDFYCAKVKLAVEVDGLIHQIGEKAAQDKAKEQILADYGIAIMRIDNDEVFNHMRMVLDNIRRECKFRAEGPLKALSACSVLNEQPLPSSSSRRVCVSLEDSAKTSSLSSMERNSHLRTASDNQRMSVQDWRDLGEKLAILYQKRTVNSWRPPNQQVAWEQRYRMAEYLKKKAVRPVLGHTD